MKPFVYNIPVKVYFGEGQLSNLGRELSKYGKKVLLTYGGGSIKKIGLYDEVIKEIKRVIGEEETIYLITTEKGITLELKNSQPGLRIIWEEE